MSPEKIKCPCCHNHEEESSFTHFQVNLASDADRKVGYPFRALELLVCPDCGVVFGKREAGIKVEAEDKSLTLIQNASKAKS